jgi:CRP/FNR family transcriptional regulator, anaerobic regulatory protein
MYTKLFQFLSAAHPMSDALKQALTACLRTEKLNKKFILLKERQVCNHVYFVESGMMRSYYMKNGSQVTSWFVYENDVITSVSSFFSRKPSTEYIQTIEETLVHYIDYDNLQRLYTEFPEFNINGRLLITKFCLDSEERLYNLRKQNAKDKVKFLQQLHPQIFQRAPLNHIASYLGISLETLSRIRAKSKKSII